MTKRAAIIIDYGASVDLSPFPIIPIGALYAFGTYIVGSSLQQLQEFGVTDVFLVSEVGAAFLADATSSFERYKKMGLMMLPEIEKRGSGGMVRDSLVLAQQISDEPVVAIGSNVISDSKLIALDEFHRSVGRPYASVMVVRGDNLTGLKAPAGYRPTRIMMLEKSLTKCVALERACSLQQLLNEAEKRNQVRYCPYEGLVTEVRNEQDYLKLVAP